MTWTDDPTKAKRIGRNIMFAGYLIGPVPAGMTIGAAITTGVSSTVTKLAVAALVIGMTVALCGGLLLNIASRADARAEGRPLGSLRPVEARRVRALGTGALSFGALSSAVCLISAALKATGVGDGSPSWLYVGLQLAVSVPLVIAGMAFRRIAMTKLVHEIPS